MLSSTTRLTLGALLLAPALWGQTLSGLEFGVEARVRSEAWNDIIDHSASAADARTQYRLRTRLWFQYSDGERFGIAAGLVNENRVITRPEGARYNGREVLFETLYVDLRLSPGLSLRAGRQNLMRGEGFILFDGTPGDGSRTAYFNAVDLAWTRGDTRLELMAISNPVRDRLLPVLNEIQDPAEQNRLVEWDERALGVYATVRPRPGLQVEGYYFLKNEQDCDPAIRGALYQPDRRFSTLGGRALREIAGGWTLGGEFALQWGTQAADTLGPFPGPSRPIRAWGGYARLKRGFQGAWKPSASLALVALSGQDPTREDRITAWNPVFSRWPRWSELYIYSHIPEKAVAYWSNTGMWELEFRCSPTAALDLRATAYRMAAREPLAATEGPVFGTGRTRGTLWQLRADLRLGARVRGHVVYERLAPGDAYRHRDAGHYLRVELLGTFTLRR